MIVQCEACQTRFRLADEKIKASGTKVRCSKCKEVFTVTLPVEEAVEEAVDFGTFNMEKLTDDAANDKASASASFAAEDFATTEQPATEPDRAPEAATEQASSDLDFSALEDEMSSGTGSGEELADDFSFVDTSKTTADTDFSIDEEPDVDEQADDFGSAFEEAEETGGPVEFEFSEEPDSPSETAAEAAKDVAEEESTPLDFDFSENEEEPQEQNEPDEFAFGDDNAFSFEDNREETPAPDAPGEFSFDDDTEDNSSATEWGDNSSSDDSSFDFDTPDFDSGPGKTEKAVSHSEEGGLQFGEINFADDESEKIGQQADDDFSKATMEEKEEPESFVPSRKNAPPAREHDNDEPLPMPVPVATKKSSLSRILVLLILLLVALGGAAGYLFMQEGTINLNTITRYLPFLQEYVGEAPVSSPGDFIRIDNPQSSYVSGQAGQMLIIQGSAANNHPSSRSAITVKGILLDSAGQPLLQQTVFCGNKLDEEELKTLSFTAIEEAMNNPFGEAFSNMNVASGASVPFTIVFRNLPAGMASINVEVISSEPGAG